MSCSGGRSPRLPEQSGVTLEVCTETVAGVLAAAAAGAHRVELCSALAEGGVTPSLGLFRQARARAQLPLHALVRPRAGDFCYDDHELSVMLADIALFREAGADGLVFGVLTVDGGLDLPRMRVLMAAAGGLPVTFHRAFDGCREPFVVLEQLVTLGVTRLLSSGRERDALVGAPFLRRLNEGAGGRLVVMAGGGVRSHNAAQVVRESGVRELHFSAQLLSPAAPSPFAFGRPTFVDETSVGAMVGSLS